MGRSDGSWQVKGWFCFSLCFLFHHAFLFFFPILSFCSVRSCAHLQSFLNRLKVSLPFTPPPFFFSEIFGVFLAAFAAWVSSPGVAQECKKGSGNAARIRGMSGRGKSCFFPSVAVGHLCWLPLTVLRVLEKFRSSLCLFAFSFEKLHTPGCFVLAGIL